MIAFNPEQDRFWWADLRNDSMYKTFLFAVILTVWGCTQNTPDEAARAHARRVADAYLDSVSMRDTGRSVTVDDAGTRWLVTYHLPEGWAGGDGTVWVDKRTMTVVDSVFEQ